MTEVIVLAQGHAYRHTLSVPEKTFSRHGIRRWFKAKRNTLGLPTGIAIPVINGSRIFDGTFHYVGVLDPQRVEVLPHKEYASLHGQFMKETRSHDSYC